MLRFGTREGRRGTVLKNHCKASRLGSLLVMPLAGRNVGKEVKEIRGIGLEEKDERFRC